MDVRRLDEMQAQGRSIFDTELAVAYYARVSTDRNAILRTALPPIPTGRLPAAMSTRVSAALRSRGVSSFSV